MQREHTDTLDIENLTDRDLVLLGSFTQYIIEQLQHILEISKTQDEDEEGTLTYTNLEAFTQHLESNIDTTTETTH